ncbi:holin [Staphylococcus sp. TE8]|uniref:phage holin n=1 Tax=Staphylococcus sp. TE8 TaxID=1472720 RepID=UPI00049F1B4D|nr:phage holin [Staphylococcus sp. TE8]KDE96560.1 holin [Staphylococcus sp. TE8]
MKINWSNRLKNGAIVSSLVGTVLLLIKQISEIFGVDLSHQLESVSGILGTILTLLAGLGIITNPNTKGVSDAGIDLDLNAPRNEETHPVQFKSESGAVKPEVFDTNEPFTDDSDEIEWDVADYENNEDLMYGQSRLHEEVK